jgi:hypothetical protein
MNACCKMRQTFPRTWLQAAPILDRLGTLPGQKTAYLLERLMHRVLSHARCNGEWFSVDLDTVVDLVERTAAADGIAIAPG